MTNEIEAEPVDLQDNRSSKRTKLWIGFLVAVLLILLQAPFAYRGWRLSQIPDIGVPFPVEDLLTPIHEEENAYPLYEEAFALLVDVSKADRDEYYLEKEDGWDSTDNQVNHYLKLNRTALEKWREATEKNDFQVAPVPQVQQLTYLVPLQSNRSLSRFCQREIERLTASGNLKEAAGWLKTSFRNSALVTRNSALIDRVVGIAHFAITTSSTEKWMEHAELTSDDLLSLLSDLEESDKLRSRPSETIQVEFLITQEYFNGWTYSKMDAEYEEAQKMTGISTKFILPFTRWHCWIDSEPELSRRIYNHFFLNVTAFIDLPRRERPPIIDETIFDESAVGVSSGRRLPAHDLIQLIESAPLFDGSFSSSLESFDTYEARYACLQVALAAHAYFRDHQKFPEALAELIPGYLESTPDDPFSRHPAPVVYRRTGEDAVVYSRYLNELDDGGAQVAHDEVRGGRPDDFGIRLRIPSVPPVSAPKPE